VCRLDISKAKIGNRGGIVRERLGGEGEMILLEVGTHYNDSKGGLVNHVFTSGRFSSDRGATSVLADLTAALPRIQVWRLPPGPYRPRCHTPTG